MEVVLPMFMALDKGAAARTLSDLEYRAGPSDRLIAPKRYPSFWEAPRLNESRNPIRSDEVVACILYNHQGRCRFM